MQISSTVSDTTTDISAIQLCYPRLTFDSEPLTTAAQDKITMSANGFQDDSSECSSDEYEIVSHQSENDHMEEESVSGSARDGEEVTDEIVSHDSVDGDEEHEDGHDHDFDQEDHEDGAFEDEKIEDSMVMPEMTDEDDSEEVGSTPTIVPSQPDDMGVESDEDNEYHNGNLHFMEMKIAEQPDLVLGVLTEGGNETRSAFVRLPMAKDVLKATGPIRIYYGGPIELKARIFDTIVRALAISKVSFDMFNVSPADIEDPDVEWERSASVRMEAYGAGLRREDCYDVAVLIDDSSTAFDQHRCIAWDLPLILIGSDDKPLSRIMASGRHMLCRQINEVSSVITDADASHVKKQSSHATAVDLEFFESIDAEQLNRHIASLVEKKKEATYIVQKSALRAAVDALLIDARDTVCEIGSYINQGTQTGLQFCREKISGSASSSSLPTQERRDITDVRRVSADPGKWLRTLISLLGTLVLLRLATYAVGALVINPSMAVGSYVGSNTMSYFHQNSNRSWVAQYISTADTIAQVQVSTTATSQPPEQTQPASKARSDIMPVYGSESRALAAHPKHKVQQPDKKCSKRCRVATWNLVADIEKLILMSTTKPSWGRVPCEPTLIAIDQSGSLVNTTLVKLNSSLYEVILDSARAKEILLVSAMLDNGYLIRGHQVATVGIPANVLADANLTANALDWMLCRHRSQGMTVMGFIQEEIRSLETTIGSMQAKAQQGAAALLEKCEKAITLSYPRAKIPEKSSTNAITKENSVAKLSYVDTKVIAAAYRTQVSRVDELKLSAWSKAQDMFSRSNGSPAKVAARDFAQELQHRSKVAVEKLQKDTLSAIKKASGQAKTLKAGLKKKTTEKMPEKKAQPAQPARVPRGYRPFGIEM